MGWTWQAVGLVADSQVVQEEDMGEVVAMGRLLVVYIYICIQTYVYLCTHKYIYSYVYV